MKSAQKSAVANGTKLLPGVDGRSPWVRRAKGLINELLADLGGAGNVNAAQCAIVRRAAMLATQLEKLEAQFATREPSVAEMDCYLRGTDSLKQLLDSVGLRRAKDGAKAAAATTASTSAAAGAAA
jgi:hypothetical protein